MLAGALRLGCTLSSPPRRGVGRLKGEFWALSLQIVSSRPRQAGGAATRISVKKDASVAGLQLALLGV